MELANQDNIQFLIIKSFDSELSTRENEVLENWLSASVDNQREYDDLRQIWDQSYDVQSTPEINVDLEWSKFRERTFSSQNKGKLIFLFSSKMARYAAILLLALFAGSVYLFIPTQYETGLNRMTVTLYDGSVIKLNQHSKLKVSKLFNWTDRDLNFEGEAYFDVAHNPSKPFTIHSSTSHIQVLGTSFNYNSNRENPKVQVNSGKVAFWADERNEALELTKGMEGEICDGQLISRQIEDPNYKSWENGIFQFDRSPLLEALEKIEAYYEIQFDLKNKSQLQACRLTASFNQYKLEEVLEELEILMNFNIEKQHPNYVLNDGSCP